MRTVSTALETICMNPRKHDLAFNANSPLATIGIKRQNLFTEKKKKRRKYFKMSCVKLLPRVLSADISKFSILNSFASAQSGALGLAPCGQPAA